MKKLWAMPFLLFGTMCLAQAQGSVPAPLMDSGNAAPDFSATSAAKSTLFVSLAVVDSFSQPLMKPPSPLASPTLTTALPTEPAPADPVTPLPKPKFIYGGRDDYRWQLSLSAVWIHFRSSVFNAEEVGLKTSVTYYLNEWLGVEGSFTGAFAPPPAGFKNEDAKLALYGGGPKIAWRQRQWEPWVHVIFGGAHEDPQTADASRSSYSIMAGGGADYRWNPRLSFRLEADYVRTGFFHQSQNNFLLGGGIVFHF